jgi:hypothetical protein
MKNQFFTKRINLFANMEPAAQSLQVVKKGLDYYYVSRQGIRL